MGKTFERIVKGWRAISQKDLEIAAAMNTVIDKMKAEPALRIEMKEVIPYLRGYLASYKLQP
jgi:hypothetical protein